MTSVPIAVQELSLLRPIARILTGAFEAATEEAAQFFEARGASVDAGLFPELVRFFVKEYLDRQSSLSAKFEADEQFERDEVQRNGLSIVYQGRRVRIWKADRDEIPPHGQSIARRHFLGQQLTMHFSADGSSSLVGMNLVILWNVDSSYRFQRFYLACPASYEGGKVRAHWTFEIPLIAEPQSQSSIISDPDTSDDLVFLSPIDISRDAERSV